jgi:hypothetical protein
MVSLVLSDAHRSFRVVKVPPVSNLPTVEKTAQVAAIWLLLRVVFKKMIAEFMHISKNGQTLP